MTFNGISDQHAYLDSIARLEQTLETPIIPGEISAWIESVGSAAAGVAQTTPAARISHDEDFQETLRQDLELAARVEQLQSDDARLRMQFHRLDHVVRNLAETADQVEPDESILEKALRSVVRRGLDFVIHARSLETAINTWFQESLLRDRGPVD